MKEFISQKQDTTCCAVAIYNACLHLEMEAPCLDTLIKRLCCDKGSSIGTDDVVKEIFGNRMVRKKPSNNSELNKYFKEFLKVGGMTSINHPIFNLHYVLCLPHEDRSYMINSWLGPNVMSIDGVEIFHFLPHRNNQVFWIFTGK